MNIECFSRLRRRSALVLSLLVTSWVMVGCGGSDNKSSSTSSSVSSSSSSSSSSVPSGDAVWPELNVTSTTPRILAFSWTEVAGATHYKLLKNADGSSGYTQVGADLATTTASDTISVHLHDWINASYIVEACNGTTCESSSPVFTSSAMTAAIGYVKASNTEANDWFGWSLALSADGSTLAVGAPAEDSRATGINGDQADNSSRTSGAVYVFTQVDGLWAQQAYVKASNTEQPNEDATQTLPNDRFGYRVALSDDGNTLVVSAILEDSTARGVNCDQGNFLIMDANDGNKIKPAQVDTGAVYVFTRTAGEWSQEAYIKASNTWINDRFGHSLALSGDGNTLAVSAINESINSKGVTALSAPEECAPANTVPSSASSISSSSSSESSISSVSSSSSSSGSPVAQNSGAVYIYVRTEHGWVPQAYVKASNTDAGDAFGSSLALSYDGATLAVGAIGEDSTATGVNGDETINATIIIDRQYAQGDIGAVYVFRRADVTWTQQAYIKPAHVAPAQGFGASIDLSADGNRLAVGAPGDLSRATGINGDPANFDIPTSSVALNAGPGAAYLFSFNGTTWAQDAYIKASNADVRDRFGHSVALSGDGLKLAVGAYNEQSLARGINGNQDDNSTNATGAVYLFTLADTNWAQQAYVKPANTKGRERFGTKVALTTDGAILAVSAFREASAATGINGDRDDESAPSAGAVYLY